MYVNVEPYLSAWQYQTRRARELGEYMQLTCPFFVRYTSICFEDIWEVTREERIAGRTRDVANAGDVAWKEPHTVGQEEQDGEQGRQAGRTMRCSRVSSDRTLACEI